MPKKSKKTLPPNISPNLLKKIFETAKKNERVIMLKEHQKI